MEVSSQLHATGLFTPKERGSDTLWIGGFVDPRTCLDAVE
jgi:hypothetical protein